MAKNFRITSSRQGNSLYFELWGDFDGIAAMELIYTLRDKLNIAEEIYVETSGIRKLFNFGQHVFETHFSITPGLDKKVTFIGDNARHVDPARMN